MKRLIFLSIMMLVISVNMYSQVRLSSRDTSTVDNTVLAVQDGGKWRQLPYGVLRDSIYAQEQDKDPTGAVMVQKFRENGTLWLGDTTNANYTPKFKSSDFLKIYSPSSEFLVKSNGIVSLSTTESHGRYNIKINDYIYGADTSGSTFDQNVFFGADRFTSSVGYSVENSKSFFSIYASEYISGTVTGGVVAKFGHGKSFLYGYTDGWLKIEGGEVKSSTSNEVIQETLSRLETYSDDVAAAAGGIAVGEWYQTTSGFAKKRVN